VHKAPDYVYFNHAVHVHRGIGCVECHGPINEMAVVTHAKPLSMDFCLTCHRAPQDYLRAPADVYNLAAPTLAAQGRLAEAERLIRDDWKIRPPQSCSGCHR
jgi:formate-dependent nitrite reductase cytochrome c552 subunit